MDKTKTKSHPLLRDTLWFLCGTAALYFVFFLFPVTGDDFFREAVGRDLHSVSDLIARVTKSYLTTNSRIMGNVLAYTAGSRPVFRALTEAAVTALTAIFAAKAAGIRSSAGRLVLFSGIFALPLAMFRQIYPWAAGFYNYVPPVTCFLAACAMIRPLFEERETDDPCEKNDPTGVSADGTMSADGKKNAFLRCAALCFLGFIGQLFMETNTLCTLAAALALVLLYRWKNKKTSAPLLWFALGAAGGAALLFLSPCYRIVGEESSIYSTAASEAGKFTEVVKDHLGEVLRDLVADSPVLYLSLTVSACAAGLPAKKRKPADGILYAVLLGGCAFFLLRGRLVFPEPRLLVLTAVTFVWAIALLACAVRFLSGNRRLRAVFYMACAGTVTAPLLVVSPIGPRCLYAGYVFLLLAAVQFCGVFADAAVSATAVSVSRSARRILRVSAVTAGAALALCILLGTVRAYSPLYENARIRDAQIAAAMNAGEPEVTVPACPAPELLWEPDGPKIVYTWYYETPGDFVIRFEKQEVTP